MHRHLSYFGFRKPVARWFSNTIKQPELPAHAKVVICGGGAIGSSIFYHLTHAGLCDVVLLEQGSIGCGTTWHAAGLISRLRAEPQGSLSRYSAQLFKEFERDGHSTGWKECGSLSVARSDDMWTALRRLRAACANEAVTSHEVGSVDIESLNPFVNRTGVKGALWMPGDGVVNPTDVVNTYTKLGKAKGGEIIERCEVQEVLTSNNRVVGVRTSAGDMRCEYFVNATGMWSRDMGLNLALHPMQHFYIISKAVSRMPNLYPVTREYNHRFYSREWSGGLLLGSFEANPLLAFDNEKIPRGFEFQLFPEDWDHFEDMLSGMMECVPVLSSTEIRAMINGPESFTLDNYPVIGYLPQIENYVISVGMNSGGILMSGGVGRAVSEMITGAAGGDSGGINLCQYDVSRMAVADRLAVGDSVKPRMGEVLRLHYQVPYPHRQYETFRDVRRSPLHQAASRSGAVFMQHGLYYEVPAYYNKASDAPSHSLPLTYHKPPWVQQVTTEMSRCVDGVGVTDQSCMGRFIITCSPEQSLVKCFHLLVEGDDLATSRVYKTLLRDRHGHYVSPVHVSRVNDGSGQRYLLTCVGSEYDRVLAYLRSACQRHLLDIEDITVESVMLQLTGSVDKLNQLVATQTLLHGRTFPNELTLDGSAGSHDIIMWHEILGDGISTLYLILPAKIASNVHERIMASTLVACANVGHMALRALHTQLGLPTWPVDIGHNTESSFGVGGSRIWAQLCVPECDLPVSGDAEQRVMWVWGGEPVYTSTTPSDTRTHTTSPPPTDQRFGTITSVCYQPQQHRLLVTATLANQQTFGNNATPSGSYYIHLAGHRVPTNVFRYISDHFLFK